MCHKKIKETDAIFEELARLYAQAKADGSVLRLSVAAKASLLIGPFSRHGASRVVVKAADHDCEALDKLTPFGIFLPDYDELYVYFTPSHLTADVIVDGLQDFWQTVQRSFPPMHTRLLNLDNGPENHSRRPQFMQRLTDFADRAHLTLQLAYSSPYPSKYNPIERTWGVLEQHWHGTLRDSRQTVLRFASTMTWKTFAPVVKLLDKVYQTGITLSQQVMARLQRPFQRSPSLGKCFVRIIPLPARCGGWFISMELP